MKLYALLFIMSCGQALATQLPQGKIVQGLSDETVLPSQSTPPEKISFDPSLIDRIRDKDYLVSAQARKELDDLVANAPCHEKALVQLETSLMNEDSRVRILTVTILGGVVKAAPELGIRTASLLVQCLKDKSVDVRFEAADTLTAMVSDEPIRGTQVLALLKPLLNDEVNEPALYAWEGVAQFATGLNLNTEVLLPLAPLLTHKDPEVRWMVASSLGELIERVPNL